MKRLMKVLAGVACLVLLATVYTQAAQAPFPVWLDKISEYTDPSGNQPYAELSGGSIGVSNAKVARFVYDTSVHGLTNAAHGLGVYLPAKAVIIRSYFKVITQFADSGTTTLALSCEDANNIKTATDITGSSANAFVEGASTGAASAFVRDIAARCEITATPAGAANNILTAGKLVGWISYVLED